MVAVISKVFFCFLFFAITSSDLIVDVPAQVTVQIQGAIYENQPISGVISIVRLVKQKVDETSFMLDGKPLRVQFVSEDFPPDQPFSRNDPEALIVSTYSFTLPSRDKGLYLINPISIKVGGVEVQSVPVTFEVQKIVSTGELKLEALVKESGPSYPGQKLTFEYRITFRNATELTKEELSLLDFEGFRGVGAPKIETARVGKDTVQTIDQTVVALAAGTFKSLPSRIEGYVLSKDNFGNMVRVPPLLTASCPPIEVQVLPFPEKDKPASFNGVLGSFFWKSRLLSQYSVAVGEKIEVEIMVTGRGDLDTVTLPDFSKQKGFKSAFRFSDIPPQGVISEGTKRFVVEMRPLSASVKEIPEMEFSSFDPVLGRYVTVRTAPIPILVRESQQKGANESPQKNEPFIMPIEIEGNVPIDAKNLSAPRFDPLFLIGTALLLASLFLLEVIANKFLKYRKLHPKEANSRELFITALKNRSSPSICFPLIRRALLLRLYEVGITDTLASNPEALKPEGVQGEIRKFLCSIDEKRFSGLGGDVEAKEVINEASQLYYRLKSMTKPNMPAQTALKVLVFLALSIFSTSILTASIDDRGFVKYTEAEKTKNIETRKKAFNEALTAYLEIMPEHPSGVLLYDIGNCYYQLGEYGFSILYYYRAKNELPRDSKINHNLEIALRKTKQESESSTNPLDFLFFLHRKFSFYEKEMATLAFMLFAFAFASFFIWLRQSVFKTLAITSFFLMLVFTCSLLWISYFAPLQAVVIRPTQLLSGPGAQYAPVDAKPALTGMKVEVEEVVEKGSWLKVKFSSGEEGYISNEQARII